MHRAHGKQLAASVGGHSMLDPHATPCLICASKHPSPSVSHPDCCCYCCIAWLQDKDRKEKEKEKENGHLEESKKEQELEKDSTGGCMDGSFL